MTLIVCFGDVRAERMRARLRGLAAHPHGLAVETRDATISARRIFCRETGAVLIDRYGCQTRLDYGDILDIAPMFPLAELIAATHGELHDSEMAPQTVEAPQPPPHDNDNLPG